MLTRFAKINQQDTSPKQASQTLEIIIAHVIIHRDRGTNIVQIGPMSRRGNG